MGGKTVYDAARDLIRHDFSGDISLDSVLAAIERAKAIPAVGDRTRSLVDLRNGEVCMSQADLKRLTEMIEEDSSNRIRGRMAFLADDPMNTALSMLYCLFQKHFRVGGVFSTEAAANDWLDED